MIAQAEAETVRRNPAIRRTVSVGRVRINQGQKTTGRFFLYYVEIDFMPEVVGVMIRTGLYAVPLFPVFGVAFPPQDKRYPGGLQEILFIGGVDKLLPPVKRATVICDEAASLSGALMDIAGTLEGSGIEYTVFDKVESNPTVECVYQAKNTADSARPDMIIGVGGGSPMDVAKAVSLLCAQAALTPEQLASGDFLDKTLPLIEIPTTSGQARK
jgi:hypothetical protein